MSFNSIFIYSLSMASISDGSGAADAFQPSHAAALIDVLADKLRLLQSQCVKLEVRMLYVAIVVCSRHVVIGLACRRSAR